MYKLCIITTNYGRDNILDLYLYGIDRLRIQCDIQIVSIVVGDITKVTEKHDVIHIPHANHPLTTKFNVACQKAREYNPDYVMVMGSDDLMSKEVLDYIISKSNADFIGIRDIYLYSLDPKHLNQMMYLKSNIVGCGRTISRAVMDKVNWKPWNIERDRGVDQVLWRTMEKHIKTQELFYVQDIGGYLVDVKTEESMNDFGRWHKNQRIPAAPVLEFLSDPEKEIIKQILHEKSKH